MRMYSFLLRVCCNVFNYVLVVALPLLCQIGQIFVEENAQR